MKRWVDNLVAIPEDEEKEPSSALLIAQKVEEGIEISQHNPMPDFEGLLPRFFDEASDEEGYQEGEDTPDAQSPIPTEGVVNQHNAECTLPTLAALPLQTEDTPRPEEDIEQLSPTTQSTLSCLASPRRLDSEGSDTESETQTLSSRPSIKVTVQKRGHVQKHNDASDCSDSDGGSDTSLSTKSCVLSPRGAGSVRFHLRAPPQKTQTDRTELIRHYCLLDFHRSDTPPPGTLATYNARDLERENSRAQLQDNLDEDSNPGSPANLAAVHSGRFMFGRTLSYHGSVYRPASMNKLRGEDSLSTPLTAIMSSNIFSRFKIDNGETRVSSKVAALQQAFFSRLRLLNESRATREFHRICTAFGVSIPAPFLERQPWPPEHGGEVTLMSDPVTTRDGRVMSRFLSAQILGSNHNKLLQPRRREQDEWVAKMCTRHGFVSIGVLTLIIEECGALSKVVNYIPMTNHTINDPAQVHNSMLCSACFLVVETSSQYYSEARESELGWIGVDFLFQLSCIQERSDIHTSQEKAWRSLPPLPAYEELRLEKNDRKRKFAATAKRLMSISVFSKLNPPSESTVSIEDSTSPPNPPPDTASEKKARAKARLAIVTSFGPGTTPITPKTAAALKEKKKTKFCTFTLSSSKRKKRSREEGGGGGGGGGGGLRVNHVGTKLRNFYNSLSPLNPNMGALQDYQSEQTITEAPPTPPPPPPPPPPPCVHSPTEKKSAFERQYIPCVAVQLGGVRKEKEVEVAPPLITLKGRDVVKGMEKVLSSADYVSSADLSKVRRLSTECSSLLGHPPQKGLTRVASLQELNQQVSVLLETNEAEMRRRSIFCGVEEGEEEDVVPHPPARPNAPKPSFLGAPTHSCPPYICALTTPPPPSATATELSYAAPKGGAGLTYGGYYRGSFLICEQPKETKGAEEAKSGGEAHLVLPGVGAGATRAREMRGALVVPTAPNAHPLLPTARNRKNKKQHDRQNTPEHTPSPTRRAAVADLPFHSACCADPGREVEAVRALCTRRADSLDALRNTAFPTLPQAVVGDEAVAAARHSAILEALRHDYPCAQPIGEKDGLNGEREMDADSEETAPTLAPPRARYTFGEKVEEPMQMRVAGVVMGLSGVQSGGGGGGGDSGGHSTHLRGMASLRLRAKRTAAKRRLDQSALTYFTSKGPCLAHMVS